MVTVFRVMHDQRYAYIVPSGKDMAAWKAKMTEGIDFDKSARGVPLRSRWDENWEFSVDEEDADSHPGGVGDFAEMNKLIATSSRGRDFLAPLLGDAAELLRAKRNGADLWLFNVIRHVDRDEVGKLDESVVFRVKPVGLDILCGAAFKNAVERSGLKGLKFREVTLKDRVRII